MKENNCRHLFLGIESGNQSTLDYYRKRTQVQDNTRALQLADSFGITTEAGIIIGSPPDDLDSVMSTFRYIAGQPLDYLGISILQVNPGSDEWKRAYNAGKLESVIDSKGNYRPEWYNADRLEPINLPSVCNNLTKRELNCLVDIGYGVFYLRRSQHERLQKRIDGNTLDRFYKTMFSNLKNTVDNLSEHSRLYPIALHTYKSAMKQNT